jgi:hypothetical protein
MRLQVTYWYRIDRWKVRATWSATEAACVFENTFQSRDNITVTMASDIALLIIMLVGLLRSRRPNYDTLRHLYAQVGSAPFRLPGH